MIIGTVNVSLTLDEANYYNDLEERDEALPIAERKYELNGEEHKYYVCPKCGEYVYEGYSFCRTCGQRLDTENTKL